ncbi:MAG: HD domain-containing protein [Nitrospirae bacterium]|nr:HD domain-containing protein [Nitrospirota bacterium]
MTSIISALKFSADKHRNQRRKDSMASPYINHPIEVAEILWNIGKVRDVNTIVAAILHDTVEDTETSPEEVKALFGKEIKDLVMEVTDDKSLPKQERKQLQIEHAPHKSISAKQIKISDKICNVTDITNHPPDNWTLQRKIDYLHWAEKVVEGLRGSNQDLETMFDEALKKGQDKYQAESIHNGSSETL